MTAVTPPLDVAALRAAVLAPAGPWTRLDVVDRTGSTNADLLAASAGAPDRTVLVAERQDSGRGRLARSWVSPPGSGLTVSVLLRPDGVPTDRFGWLPLLAGLALLDTVRAHAPAPAALKWPNDLLLGPDQRKVAGILAEAVTDAAGPAVVIGIGINVGAAPPDQPGATCLAAEVPAPATPDRQAVLVSLLVRLSRREAAWRAAGGDPDVSRLRAEYRAGCASLGTRVRVDLPDGTSTTGVAEDVDRDGRLLLLDRGGRRLLVAAGDVVHLRPAG